jgi:hypothetical protein
MVRKIYLLVLFILIGLTGYCQYGINRFSAKIKFDNPDKINWNLVSDDMPADNAKGRLVFKHKPIKDSKNRPVEPLIAILYEKVTEDIDVIQYSAGILGEKPFKIDKKLLGGFPDFSSDKHSVVFRGNYIRENVGHKILLGYILCNKIGLEIICDATDETFSKVESDFNKIIKSLRIIE